MKIFLVIILFIVFPSYAGQILKIENSQAIDNSNKSNDIDQHVTSKSTKKNLTPSPLDIQLVWDQFYHRGTLIWACRGAQTGDFVPASYCASQPKVDTRWPDKKTPPGYDGFMDLY